MRTTTGKHVDFNSLVNWFLIIDNLTAFRLVLTALVSK